MFRSPHVSSHRVEPQTLTRAIGREEMPSAADAFWPRARFYHSSQRMSALRSSTLALGSIHEERAKCLIKDVQLLSALVWRLVCLPLILLVDFAKALPTLSQPCAPCGGHWPACHLTY